MTSAIPDVTPHELSPRLRRAGAPRPGKFWLAIACAGFCAAATAAPDKAAAFHLQSFAHLPMSFEENKGQVDAQARYFARGQGYAVFLTPDSAVLTLRSTVGANRRAHTRGGEKPLVRETSVRLSLAHANPNASVAAEEPLPGIVNYFLGNDPAGWRTSVPTFAKVRYHEIYRGVDLVYYGNPSQLEYDFVVAPGADADVIELKFEGADGLELDADGNLSVHANGGELRWHKPVAYQMDNGVRREVQAEFDLQGKRGLKFRVGPHDASLPLVIDPVVIFSTYLGGNNTESSCNIALDPQGNIYVAGSTISTNFPVLGALQATNRAGSNDLFVTKLNSNGTALVYSTYIGGNADDFANYIAVDRTGNAYVVGYTEADNFPVTNAYDSSLSAFGDAFLLRLAPTGNRLLYSTFFGSSSYESANAVAVDNNTNAYIVGHTYSGNFFPTAPNNPFLPTGSDGEGFIAKFNLAASGSSSLIYSSYFGGDTDESANAVAIDGAGNAYVAGTVAIYTTNATSTFPVQNSLPGQNVFKGGFSDAFVMKVNANASLGFSTFLGGINEDEAYGIALDANTNVFVTGSTSSDDFPTKNPQEAILGNGYLYNTDAFITELSSSGTTLLYSTFFGGSSPDTGLGIATDIAGNIYLIGLTDSDDLTVTPGSPQQYPNGQTDLFVAKINPLVQGPSGIIFSSYLGGSASEPAVFPSDSTTAVAGIAVDTNFNFFVTSGTYSTNFPVSGTNVFQPTAPLPYTDTNSWAFVAGFASPADMSVATIASTNIIMVTSNYTYTLFINNNGAASFSSVTVTDQLPASFLITSVTNSAGTLTTNGNAVSCALGTMTNRASATVTIKCVPQQPGILTNIAYLTATESEPNTNNNKGTYISLVRGIADIGLTMTNSPPPNYATSNLTYTITVTNKGPFTATSVFVTNTMPAGMAFISATNPQGSYDFADTNIVVFSIASISNAASAALTVVGRPLTSAAFVTNRASYSAFELDPVAGNNDATNRTAITLVADVAVTSKIGAPDTVLATSNLVYTILVTNFGPVTASSCTFTDALPAGCNYVSASSSRAGSTVSQSAGIVSVALNNFTNGAKSTITITVKPQFAGPLVNTATIYTTSADFSPGNNSFSATNNVSPNADVGVTKTAVTNSVIVTSNISYTITVTNRGPTPASGIVVSDPVPPNSTFVSAGSTQGTCTNIGGVITCSVGDMTNGVSATITVTLATSLEGSLTNTATVSSGVNDPASANNTSKAVATVLQHPNGPILRIARKPGVAAVNWFNGFTNHVLLSTGSFNDTNGVVWSGVTNPVVTVGSQFFVTNVVNLTTNSYFRLSNTVPTGP